MDTTLFEFLNQQIANPFFDAVLPVYREKTTWIPLYLLMVFLLWRSYGWRRAAYLLICLAVVLTVADQLAATVIKPWVGRLRPCADPETATTARLLVNCGGKFSFPSNHATNHFAVAMLLSLTWLRRSHWVWRLLIFAWAATIALAQVYVGKHFPSDIVAGAALGMAVATAGAYLYRRLRGSDAIV